DRVGTLLGELSLHTALRGDSSGLAWELPHVRIRGSARVGFFPGATAIECNREAGGMSVFFRICCGMWIPVEVWNLPVVAAEAAFHGPVKPICGNDVRFDGTT